MAAEKIMFSWNHKPHLRKAQNSDFHTGETWRYRTRPHERDSTLFVWRVETLPDGENVVHIKVEGLRLVNPSSPDEKIQVAQHLPLSETALSACVTQRVSTSEALPMPDGYEEWRREWEGGRAGVFSIALSEVIEGLESAMKGTLEE